MNTQALKAKQREAFEHWYSEAGRWPKSVARGEDGHYLLAQANSSYEAWRAAVSTLQQQPESVATEEAAYQRGKRAGYIDGYRAAHADERQQPDISPALQQQEVPREPDLNCVCGAVWERGANEWEMVHSPRAASPPDCPHCGGVGEREVFYGHLGPDSFSELTSCPDCNGTGNAPATQGEPS